MTTRAVRRFQRPGRKRRKMGGGRKGSAQKRMLSHRRRACENEPQDNSDGRGGGALSYCRPREKKKKRVRPPQYPSSKTDKMGAFQRIHRRREECGQDVAGQETISTGKREGEGGPLSRDPGAASHRSEGQVRTAFRGWEREGKKQTDRKHLAKHK